MVESFAKRKLITFLPPKGGKLFHTDRPVLGEVDPVTKTKLILHPGMWPSQELWWNLPNRVRMLVAGFGLGKTRMLCQRMIYLALVNAPVPVAIVSPTYPMASKTTILTTKEILSYLSQCYEYWRSVGVKQAKLTWTQRKTSPHEFYIQYHEEGRRSCYGTILVYSGEDPDKLRGPNLAAAGIDEPFLQEQAVFEQMYVRCRHPQARRREVNLTGCVPRNTLVLTETGYRYIGDLDPGCKDKQFLPLGIPIYGRGGFHKATKFFSNGVDDTIKLTATNGYTIEGTPDHPVMVMGADGIPVFKRLGARKGKYAHLGQVAIGDWLGVTRGMEVWGNKSPKGLTNDDAYGLGVWLAEGSRYKNEVTITCGDETVLQHFENVGMLGSKSCRKKAANRNDQTRVCSPGLPVRMQEVGIDLVKSPHRHLPQWVLGAGTREHAIEFISGMYDGDGHVCADGKGGIGYTTTSEKLVHELRAVLLNLGVVTNLRESVSVPTALVLVHSRRFQLLAFAQNARLLASILKLRIKRKREALELYKRDMRDSDVVPHQGATVVEAWGARERRCWSRRPMTAARTSAAGTNSHEPNKIVERASKGVPLAYSTLRDFVSYWHANEAKPCAAIKKLEQTLAEGLWWGQVTSLVTSESDTVDFVIPDTHTFVSGCGVMSYNTPEQMNWGAELAEGDLNSKYDVGLVQASTLENKALPEDYVQSLVKAWDPKVARAYLHGMFVNLSKGLVYYSFNKSENVVELPMPNGAEIGVGMDFNVDPMAAVVFWFVRNEKHKHIHFFDEIELANSDTREMAAELSDIYKNPGIVRPYCAESDSDTIHITRSLRTVYPDSNAGRHTSSPGGKTDYDYLREAGYEIEADPRGNPLRKDRYNSVNSLLREVDGRVRMTVSPRCKKLIKYQQQYAHELMKKPTQKAMGHLLDARDYPVWRLFPADRDSIKLMRVKGA